MRGLEKVRGELSLTALAYNLRRARFHTVCLIYASTACRSMNPGPVFVRLHDRGYCACIVTIQVRLDLA